jgi:hypothetical protein
VVLFLHNTSRLKEEPYPDLLQEKGGRGFPYLVFLDAEGNVIARHEAERTVDRFQATKARAEAFLELRKKAAQGDRAAKIDLLAARADLQPMTLEAAKAEAAALSALSPEESARLEPAFLSLEVREIVMSRETSGPKLVELWKAGRVPTGGIARAFWSGLASHAIDSKDRALLADLLARLRQDYGTDERWKPMIESLEKRLEGLSSGGGG